MAVSAALEFIFKEVSCLLLGIALVSKIFLLKTCRSSILA